MTAPRRRSPRPGDRLPNGAAPRNDHRCPCGCGSQIPNRLLACREGWFRLPRHLRALFDHGKGRQSGEQMEAVAAAVEWYIDNPRQEK